MAMNRIADIRARASRVMAAEVVVGDVLRGTGHRADEAGVALVVGGAYVLLTPNGARRLVAKLEASIRAAERTRRTA